MLNELSSMGSAQAHVALVHNTPLASCLLHEFALEALLLSHEPEELATHTHPGPALPPPVPTLEEHSSVEGSSSSCSSRYSSSQYASGDEEDGQLEGSAGSPCEHHSKGQGQSRAEGSSGCGPGGAEAASPGAGPELQAEHEGGGVGSHGGHNSGAFRFTYDLEEDFERLMALEDELGEWQACRHACRPAEGWKMWR